MEQAERAEFIEKLLISLFSNLPEDVHVASGDTLHQFVAYRKFKAHHVLPGNLVTGEPSFHHDARYASFVFPDQLAHQIVRFGVPSSSMRYFCRVMDLGKSEAAGVLELNRSTVHRKTKTDDALPRHSAEIMLRVLALQELAESIFETPEEASSWMQRPHPMLEGESPIEAAKSSFGTQRVKDILNALKYGGVV